MGFRESMIERPMEQSIVELGIERINSKFGCSIVQLVLMFMDSKYPDNQNRCRK